MDFCLHSLVRSPRTRVARAKAPVHIRRQQFVLKTQQRLLPGRRIMLNEDAFKANLNEIRDLVRQGILEVRTPAGQIVDVNTFAISPLEQQLMPHPRLDDANNDPPAGRAVRKVDMSLDVAKNPEAPVDVMSKEPIPKPIQPPERAGGVTPALHPNTPYIPRKNPVTAKLAANIAAPEPQPTTVEQEMQAEAQNPFGGPSIDETATDGGAEDYSSEEEIEHKE